MFGKQWKEVSIERQVVSEGLYTHSLHENSYSYVLSVCKTTAAFSMLPLWFDV